MKQREENLLAKTLYGLEDALAGELKQIGAKNIKKINRAVSFTGDLKMIYLANLRLRTAINVLLPIDKFYAHDPQRMYRRAKRIEWDQYFDVSKTIMIGCTSFGTVFNHSHFAALKLKDAIADYFRQKTGSRPNVDKHNPDIKINLHIVDRQCTVSLDSSGLTLDKRGYRTVTVDAPMNEVLAAGLLINSGISDYSVFHDPMCGSGTLPIEAAMIAQNKAPGLLRNFSFENWRNFDEDIYMDLRSEVQSEEKPQEMEIIASDLNMKTTDACKSNAGRAGVDDNIEIKNMDFFQSFPDKNNGMIMTNPPYGERLNEGDDITDFYKKIGDHLKNNYQGWDAYIFSGNLQALKNFGLKASAKEKYFNGAIECRLNKFELYKGSKKA